MNFNFLDDGSLIYTLIFFFGFFSIICIPGKKMRYLCFYIIVLSELLISSLRGLTVGQDTYVYVMDLIPQLKSVNYVEILRGNLWFAKRDPFCYCFLKFISTPFANYTTYFFILESIYWILIADTMKRYSKDPLLTLFVFISFRFSFFNMSAIRQSIALAISVFSYRYYVAGKSIKYLICILFASLFHFSAIVSLLLLLVGKFTLINKRWLVYIIAVAFVAFSYMLSTYFGLAFIEHSEFAYSNYIAKNTGGGNYFSVLFILLLFVLINLFLSNNRNIEKRIDMVKAYNILTIAFLMSMAGFFVSLIFRASMYFSYLVPIIYSNALVGIKPKSKYNQWLMIGLFCMLGIYIFTGVIEAYVPYKFYWEK